MPRRRFRCRFDWIVLACSLLCAGEAAAVMEGSPWSRSLEAATSARASGMGGVTAILDDGAVGLWWNPGMAALDRKGQINLTSSDLAMGLDDNINMKTWSITSGRIPAGPVDIAVGLGRARLNLGSSEAIDEQGDLIRTFDSYDVLYNILFGLSWRGIAGAGIVLERTKSLLSPDIPELGLEDGAGEAKIWGASFGFGFQPDFRYDMENGFVPPLGDNPPEEKGPGAAFSPLFGWSYLHVGQDIEYNETSGKYPQPKQSHVGYGFKIGVDAGTTGELLDWRRLLRLEFTTGWEAVRSKVGSEEEIDLDGYEFCLGGIYSIRRGNVDDPDGYVIDSTEGWGVGIEGIFPIGFRYDEAEVPQAKGLPDVTRKEFRITADLNELMALLGE